MSWLPLKKYAFVVVAFAVLVVALQMFRDGKLPGRDEEKEDSDRQNIGGDPPVERDIILDIIQPRTADRHEVFLSDYGEITVYGADRNTSTEDEDEHIYLYLPPLRLKMTDDGRLDVQRGVLNQTVQFWLEGSSSRLAANIHEALNEKGVSVLLKNVRPLQYSFIALGDDSRTWRAYVPRNRAIPLTQPWIRFVAEFETGGDRTDPAGDFLERLNSSGGTFQVLLGYGGQELVSNTVELTTQQLLDTDFYADLSGDGESKYVTRNQVRTALASVRTDIVRRYYREDPTVNVPPLEWPDNVWERQTVAWDDFLEDYLQDMSRYGLSGNDLSPNRFNQLAKRLKDEMENEDKDFIEISGEFSGEADFLGIFGGASSIGGASSSSGSLKKEDFARHRRSNDYGLEWEGEVYWPKSIDLLVMDESALERDDSISSYVITPKPAEQRLEFTITTKPKRGGGAPPPPPKDLRVAKGERITITQEENLIHVNHWIMEDESTIVIADDVDELEIRAHQATIGRGVRILGRGRAGTHSGQPGGKGTAGPCTPGVSGDSADRGGDGRRGKIVRIKAGVVGLKSLEVDVQGGAGGNGGKGGQGQHGGRAKKSSVCNGQDGGRGGAGGAGGAGGDGGTVQIDFWQVAEPVIGFGNTVLKVDGGNGGEGGPGGDGGDGGEERCYEIGVGFLKVKHCLDPGSRGGRGSHGQHGEPGLPGSMEGPEWHDRPQL